MDTGDRVGEGVKALELDTSVGVTIIWEVMSEVKPEVENEVNTMKVEPSVRVVSEGDIVSTGIDVGVGTRLLSGEKVAVKTICDVAVGKSIDSKFVNVGVRELSKGKTTDMLGESVETIAVVSVAGGKMKVVKLRKIGKLDEGVLKRDKVSLELNSGIVTSEKDEEGMMCKDSVLSTMLVVMSGKMIVGSTVGV